MKRGKYPFCPQASPSVREGAQAQCFHPFHLPHRGEEGSPGPRAGHIEEANELLRKATRTIDKAKTKGVLKANTARRKISRLARAVAQKAAASTNSQ